MATRVWRDCAEVELLVLVGGVGAKRRRHVRGGLTSSGLGTTKNPACSHAQAMCIGAEELIATVGQSVGFPLASIFEEELRFGCVVAVSLTALADKG